MGIFSIKRTTRFPGGLSVGGGPGNNRATSASTQNVMSLTFDPTAASQVLIGTLPINARVQNIVSWGGATGGASPTVDIGTLGVNQAFAAALRSDVKTNAFAAGTLGAMANTTLTTATPVYGKVGASAPTGGAVQIDIYFTIIDL